MTVSRSMTHRAGVGGIVYHDVIQLCIVMRDALGAFSLSYQIQQHRSVSFPSKNEVDLGFNVLGPVFSRLL